MHTFICIMLWIDEWSKTNYNIGCHVFIVVTTAKFVRVRSLVKSRGANRLLANEVVGPPRPKGAVERSGLGSSNYRRKTCDTRNRYFAYNREEFWLESRTSDVGQGIGPFWTGHALSQKSWSHCCVSPIVCSHRAFAQENSAIRHYCSANSVDRSSSLANAYSRIGKWKIS